MASRARRRLGPRYARLAPALPIQVLYLVDVAGLAALSLYIDMSLAEFGRLLAATFVIQTAYNAFLVHMARRRLGAVDRWLAGERGASTSAAAWSAAASLPVEFLRSTWRYGFYLWGNAAWSAYAVWDLGLPVVALPAVMAGVLIAQLYGFTLIFLALERVMRPIVEEIAEHLPENASLDAPGVPLRWRLLATLPIINIITGATVAGLSAPDGADVGDLWVDVLLAVAVAFTVSLWLTLRLAESVTTPVNELRAATQRVGSGDLRTRVPVVSTDEPGRLAQAFNRMVRGLQERERLRDAFGAYVDPELAEQVAAEGTALEGREVELSVLFMDVRDFTGLAERAGPAETVAALNALYDCAVPVVLDHGGHANKFIGDGMLAVFGAPSPHPDHADRAVAAGLALARAVWERFDEDLRVGVGINSGRALVGTIGGGGRLDFTVIGDSVNTAARAESATRELDEVVAITDATRRRLTRHHAEWTPRGTLALKGKADAVALFGAAAGGIGRETLRREDAYQPH